MKTKEEVIKEAWGENYIKGIDENGWLSENYLTNDQCKLLNNNKLIEHTKIAAHDLGYYDSSISIYRPKSLQGIENNNGWIRIESESDLPNEVGYYLVYNGTNTLIIELNSISFKNKLIEQFKKDGFTHYQPIVKPNKPLY